MALSPENQKKLSAFLGNLPETLALKLHKACQQALAAGDASLPYEMMIEALKPVADQARDPRNHPVMGGAMDLVTDDPAAPAVGHILSDSIQAIQTFAETAEPDLIADIRTGARPRIAGRSALGQALYDEISRRLNEEDGRRRLISELGGERVFDDLEKVVSLLRAEPELSEILHGLPNPIETIDETMLGRLRDEQEALYEKDAGSSLLFMFLIFQRLSKPWLILRVARKVTNRDDDLLLSRTDYGALGDMLIKRAESYLPKFQMDRRGEIDAEATLAAVTAFAALVEGVKNEIILHKDGDWAKAIRKAQTRAADQMESICWETPRAIEKAFPTRRIKLRGSVPATRPATDTPPDDIRVKHAHDFCKVLRESRVCANAAAFASARVRAFDVSERALSDYAALLVDHVAETHEREMAPLEPWIEATETCLRRLLGDDAADIFRRRVWAAQGRDAPSPDAVKESQDAA